MAGPIRLEGPLQAALVVTVAGLTKTWNLSDDMLTARVTTRATCGVNDAEIACAFPSGEGKEFQEDAPHCTEVTIIRKDPTKDPEILAGEIEKIEPVQVGGLTILKLKVRDRVGREIACQPVSKEYAYTPSEDIVNDLLDTYMPGLTPSERVVTTGGPVVPHFRASGIYLDDALRRLALISGQEWWIDAGVFRWENAEDNPAGEEITSEGADPLVDAGGIGVKRDATSTRNRIEIYSQGEYEPYETEFMGDGRTTEFPVKHPTVPDVSGGDSKPTLPTATVIDPVTGDSTVLDVGHGNRDGFLGVMLDVPYLIDGTPPPPFTPFVPTGDGAHHDALWYPDPMIKLAQPLPLGNVLKLEYAIQVPTKRVIEDTAAQADCGVRTQVVPATGVASDDAAQSIGDAMLECLAEPKVRGTLKLTTDKIAGLAMAGVVGFARPASVAFVRLTSHAVAEVAKIAAVERVYYNQPVTRPRLAPSQFALLLRSMGVATAASMADRLIQSERRMETSITLGCCHGATEKVEDLARKLVEAVTDINEPKRPYNVRTR